MSSRLPAAPLRFAVAVLLLLLARPAPAIDTCARGAGRDAAAATAQRLLDVLAQTNGAPGMGAAVYRDGGVVWTGCTGWRDIAARKPVRADTVFRLASISKLVTATAVARLAERGALDLDAPIGDVLPWLRGDWPAISLRQLAAHVAGVAHYSDADADRSRAHYATARAAAGRFVDRPLLAAPGTAYQYSSWGFTLIGAVIEAHTGQSFLDHVLGQITAGLAIRADSDGRGGDVARLYVIGGGKPRIPPPYDYSHTWAGGGLAATPEAIVRFGARVMDGSLVSSRTWAAMREPLRLRGGGFAGEREFRVGLGWRVSQDDDGAVIAHHSGSAEGSRSVLLLWPEERSAVSLLSNAQWASAVESTAMLLAAPFRSAAGAQAAACPLRATRYQGQLGDTPVGGAARVRIERGRCIAELVPDAALQAAFAAATAWPNRRLTLIALDADRGLGRAALVTPLGLYPARAGVDARWSVALGGGVTLQIGWAGAAR